MILLRFHLKSNPPTQLILETKGFDELKEIKRQAADRWVNAVNADGTFGKWKYELALRPSDVANKIADAMKGKS